jgi:uncharacterized membrane protein (DUF373 family)
MTSPENEGQKVSPHSRADHYRTTPSVFGRSNWNALSFYEKFEQAVAIALGGVIAVIIILSLFQLIRAVYIMLVLEAFNPLDHDVFQTIFGMILTLLIALEFKHSIIRVAMRSESIIQVKTVVLIALIARSRKMVILEADTSAATIAALWGALLSLGLVYWLLRERDDHWDEMATQIHSDRN